MKTPQQLIKELINNGGAIVRSDVASVMEITNAQATNRFATNEEGIGLILRYPEWVAKAQAAQEAIRNLPPQPHEDAR